MRIAHPDKRVVGYEGKTYVADKNGSILVPDNATSFLNPVHGFVIVDDPVIRDDITNEAVIGITATPKRGRPKKVRDDDTIHDAS